MSWRTSLTGLFAILTVIADAAKLLLDGNAATNPDWNLVAAGIITGVGLLTARDHKVSSEQAGLKEVSN